MIQLAYWAKYHPIAARTLIVVSRCILFLIAWFLGRQLAISVLSISPLWLYFFLVLFLSTCTLYPSQKSAATFRQRKCCDFIVCISGFLMTVLLTVQLHQRASFYHAAHATVPVGDPVFKYAEAQRLLQQFKDGEKTSFTRKEKRSIRKEFNHQLVRYGAATVTGNKEAQGNAGVIILACIAALGLLSLVAMLACSLSCNGADAAAIAVGILGTAAIVWGLVAVIKSASRKKVPDPAPVGKEAEKGKKGA